MGDLSWLSHAPWVRIERLSLTDTRGKARVDDLRVLIGVVDPLQWPEAGHPQKPLAFEAMI
jgi:hypothetical protein